jgi:hypothetical protein
MVALSRQCFRGFICMLQVFYVDVAKVDRDVAMVIHVCCTSIPNVSSIFFISMLQMCLF